MNDPGSLPMNKEYADSGGTGNDRDVLVGATVDSKWGDLGGQPVVHCRRWHGSPMVLQIRYATIRK
jgi:hypothetical protein